ncbi:acyl-CoA synthetase [Mycobacteriaceae bacterium 1482268.1]|nr:acyl-CoA synthetase [Mycobacteriaceae bacterium 1482268.1]
MALNVFNPLGESVEGFRVLTAARLIAPLRPDRYLRMIAAIRRAGVTATAGFAMAAARCPDRAGLIDESGVVTWKELDRRCDALAFALQNLSAANHRNGTEPPKTIAILCRNHRFFIEALVASDRSGADVLLLNTSFSAQALADVVARESVDAIIYDDEFFASVASAFRTAPAAARIRARCDRSHCDGLTVDGMIAQHPGKRPRPPQRRGTTILLTSGTTGTPKGARRAAGGGARDLIGILKAVPWRAEEKVVIAAPMFHAWGYSQLLFAAWMACTIVTRRKFDPEATLTMIDGHQCSGLCAVPVMLERITDLPTETLGHYTGTSLRFAAVSGSRMRADAVTAFMDRFGDVIYNHYNATEAGMITLATPNDLRAAPDTAGRAVAGTEIVILGDDDQPLGPGRIGQIFTRSATHFDGYTSGTGKRFHRGYMATGDLGYLDDAGRLFVVGRDDEMIVSGAENVYPAEVENCLLTHLDVAEAVVIGVDDAQFGQRLVAYVVPRDQAAVSAEDLKQFVREGLAGFKVPRQVLIVDQLPRTGTGKVARSELRAHLGDSAP